MRQLFSAHKDHIDILEKWIVGTQGLMTVLPVKEGYHYISKDDELYQD